MATPDLAPLPGVSYYGGTMTAGDIYPQIARIGGMTTQHSTLPAVGEAAAQRATKALSLSNVATGGLLGTPAGYLVLAIVALVVLSHVIKS